MPVMVLFHLFPPLTRCCRCAITELFCVLHINMHELFTAIVSFCCVCCAELAELLVKLLLTIERAWGYSLYS